MTADTVRGLQKTVQEVPGDMIREVSKHLSEVLIRVKRRNARGQLAAITGMSGIRKPTLELLDIETWVGETLGGGNYRIEVANPHNPMDEPPLPAFQFEIEGPPKVWSSADVGMGGHNGIPGFRMPPAPGPMASAMAPGSPMAASPYGGTVMIPPAGVAAAHANGGVLPSMPGLTGFAAGLPPAMQWAGYGWQEQPNTPTAPGASMSSDQVALMSAGQLREDNLTLKKELAELRAAIDSVHDVHRAELAKRDEDMRKLHEERKEREHKLELQLLERRFEALTAQNKPQPQTDTIAQMVPLLTALAPVLTAVVQNSASASTRQAEMQFKMLEAQSKRPAQDWAPLLAATAPIVMKFMEQRGPEAQAAVWETMMQNNMQSLSLIGQFMAETAKGDSNQSPWLPLIQAALEGGMNTLGAYMESRQQQQLRAPQQPVLSAHGQTRPLGAPQQPQQYPQHQQHDEPQVVTPQPVNYTTQPRPNYPYVPKVNLDVDAIVRMVAQSQLVPEDFKTSDWLAIIADIHAQIDVPTLAASIVTHVDDLTNANQLPDVLNEVWTDPQACYGRLLQGLPIGQANPLYARSLLQHLVQATAERLAESDAAEDAPAEDAPEEALVTAPPAAKPPVSTDRVQQAEVMPTGLVMSAVDA